MFRNFCSFALSCLSFMFVFQNITEAQSCNSQINVTGWDKYYEWSTSDIISSTAVGYFLDWEISDTLALAQAAERGCLPGISKYGFSFTGDDFSWTGFMFGVVGTPLTPSYNEQVVNIAMPDIGGCEGPPIQEIQYMGGSTGLYAFSIGSGT